MSKITIALESFVADVIANSPADGGQPTARQRAAVDRAFGATLKLIAPRIRHFIRKYGLMGHWEDAEQAAAIGVYRAIQSYDPAKAQFTTFVNWQIRGELQALRFRLMTDQRPSAKKVEATTVSLQGMGHTSDGEEIDFEALIEDEGAQGRVEAGASDHMAHETFEALLDLYIKDQRNQAVAQLQRKLRARKSAEATPAGMPRLKMNAIDPRELALLEERLNRDREIVRRRIFDLGSEDETVAEFGVTKERMRQITKQAARAMAELVTENPRFSMMAMFAGRGAAAEKLAARGKVKEAAPVTELLPAPRVRPEGRVKVSVVETGRAFPGTPAPAAPLPKRLPVPSMPIMPAHLAATPEARAV